MSDENYFEKKIGKSIHADEVSPLSDNIPLKKDFQKPNLDFIMSEIDSEDFEVFRKGFISLDAYLSLFHTPPPELPPNFFQKLLFCIDYIEDISSLSEKERAKPPLVEDMESLVRQLLKLIPGLSLAPIMECEIPQSLISKIPLIDPSNILSILYQIDPETIISIASEDVVNGVIAQFNRYIRQNRESLICIRTLSYFIKANALTQDSVAQLINKVGNVFDRQGRDTNSNNEKLGIACLNFFESCQSEEYILPLIQSELFSNLFRWLNNPYYNINGKIFDIFTNVANDETMYAKLIEENIFYFCFSNIDSFKGSHKDLGYFLPAACRLIIALLSHREDDSVISSFNESQLPNFLNFIFDNESIFKDHGTLLSLLDVLYSNDSLSHWLNEIDLEPLFNSIMDSTNDELIHRLLLFLLPIEQNDMSTPFFQNLNQVVNEDLFRNNLEELVSSTNPDLAAPAETLVSRFYETDS